MAVTLSAALNALASTSAPDKVIVLEGSTAKQTDPANVGGGVANVEAKTADFTANGDSGTVYTNGGATGVIQCVLSNATAGTIYYFVCNAEQTLSIAPSQNSADNRKIFWYDPVSNSAKIATGFDDAWLKIDLKGSACAFVKVNTSDWQCISNNGIAYESL